MDAAIDIEGLSKTFPSSPTAALSHISAQIPRGQMVGLVGPDGSGKTTLIRLMASLLKPSSGSIRILGHDTMSAPDAIHSLTGYMPQRFGLYDELTVRQNLTLYFELQNSSLEDKEALFERLLNFTRLEPFTERLAKDLSGGMKQKLGLACALLRRPKLLLLDEPSVGVDPLSRRELWDMVHGLIEEGISVIWSTAYLDEAEKCDTILLMNEGKVLFWGPPKQCMERVEGRTFITQNLHQSHPQALKISIPSIVNTFIALFKDTSLVSIIGLLDLLNMAQTTARSMEWKGYDIEAYLFAGFVYWAFCYGMSRYSQNLERKLDTNRRD